jgi:hypothetical protein
VEIGFVISLKSLSADTVFNKDLELFATDKNNFYLLVDKNLNLNVIE